LRYKTSEQRAAWLGYAFSQYYQLVTIFYPQKFYGGSFFAKAIGQRLGCSSRIDALDKLSRTKVFEEERA